MRTATAATRLTTDSAASESSPTDPVTCQAMALRVIVATAAAIDRYANRLRSRGWSSRPPPVAADDAAADSDGGSDGVADAGEAAAPAEPAE
jgi:hypothetical protein